MKDKKEPVTIYGNLQWEGGVKNGEVIFKKSTKKSLRGNKWRMYLLLCDSFESCIGIDKYK